MSGENQNRLIPSEMTGGEALCLDMRLRYLAVVAFVNKDPERLAWHLTVPIDDIDFVNVDTSAGGLDTTFDLDGSLLENAPIPAKPPSQPAPPWVPPYMGQA